MLPSPSSSKNYFFRSTKNRWIDEKTFSIVSFHEATFSPLSLLSFFHVNKLYEKRWHETVNERGKQQKKFVEGNFPPPTWLDERIEMSEKGSEGKCS